MKWFITRKEIDDKIDEAVNETIRAINILSKRCQTCGSGLIKFIEWTPDGAPYYFCNNKCYVKWHKESKQIYSAMPLKEFDMNE